MSKRVGQQSLPFAADNGPPGTPFVAAPQEADVGATSAAARSSTSPLASARDLDGLTVFAIDAHALIFQVFHALPEMTDSRGEPVAAVYGFARDVLHLMAEKRPDCLLCAFDMPGPTFRHEVFAAYKAHRAAMPDDLAVQLPKIRALLDALGVPILEHPGYEADDILATVARTCEARGACCRLVTTDKDCRQLITDRVVLYDIRKDEVFDSDSLARVWGIRPDQVVDFQTLVGDPTDNVPGIPLIGPKIARALLQSYGTLENVLDHAHEVKGAKRSANLRAGRETARVSRRLARLDAHVPIDIDFHAGRVGHWDQARVLDLFAELGFHSLRAPVARLQPGGAAVARSQADYQLVDSPEALAAFARQLSGQKRIALDIETTHEWPRWAEIVGYAFAWAEGEAYYLPVRAPAGQRCLDPRAVLTAVAPILADPAVAKVGRRLKYDQIVLRNVGVHLAGLAFDTTVASYLLDAGSRNHGLDELSRRYLQHTPAAPDRPIRSEKQRPAADGVPVADVARVVAERADLTLRVQPLLAQRLHETGLDRLFTDLELPLLEVLADMESRGIRIDVERLGQLRLEFGARIVALEQEIYALAGHKLNIGSTRQLAAVLFEEQGLPIVKRTKSGPSTDAGVLAQLAQLHALPAQVLAYRHYAKLLNTYVEALPGMVHPDTGRVHASFNQVVAATGRLSASDPNLQNIPVRTEAGREIRSAFLAGPEGWRLLAADYSQIELRVLAHFSADPELARAFQAEEDVHTRVASEIFALPPAAVTSDMRRRAKAVNFGVIYGQSPFGLARALGIERDEAAAFIEAYFARYPAVEEFLATSLESCREKGYVETILGRRRAIRGVRAGVSRGLNLPERAAVNTVIQGSAADLIKLAMVSIHRRLCREEWAARMVLQIHDELVFEVPPEELDRLAQLVKKEMCGALELVVPLAVDLKSGVNWAECEPWQVGPGGGSGPQRCW